MGKWSKAAKKAASKRMKRWWKGRNNGEVQTPELVDGKLEMAERLKDLVQVDQLILSAQEKRAGLLDKLKDIASKLA